MPKIEYLHQPLPGREEFRRMLREVHERYDPIEELLRLHTELGSLEQKHGLSSEECYLRFMAGQMGDEPEIFGWVGRYKAFLRLKTTISDGLNVVITES